MRKSRTPGSVRGVSGNGYPYRDILLTLRLMFSGVNTEYFVYFSGTKTTSLACNEGRDITSYTVC